LVRRGEGKPQSGAVFGIDESNVQLWWKHKAAISWCEASRRKVTGPKKGLFVSYDLLREEVIKKARTLNIPRSRFKASKASAIAA
jgi:hypothetical protein